MQAPESLRSVLWITRRHPRLPGIPRDDADGDDGQRNGPCFQGNSDRERGKREEPEDHEAERAGHQSPDMKSFGMNIPANSTTIAAAAPGFPLAIAAIASPATRTTIIHIHHVGIRRAPC